MINQNKVQLFEEFAAGEVSGTEQNVTPASKTEPASVAVDKTVAEPQGAELRAEIIKDVDSILTNLETLSTRIQENLTNLANDIKEGVELDPLVLEALEALNAINEGEINEEGPSKVMDLIWYAPKAKKAMQKVNKVRNNQVAIELAKDQLPNDKENKAKKDKLKDKAASAKTKADELERAVRDKFSDRGDLVSKAIAKEDIKGKLERIKKETGMSDDPKKKKDLKTQYKEMDAKLKQEEEAMKELAADVDKADVKQKKEEIEANDGQPPAEDSGSGKGSPKGSGEGSPKGSGEGSPKGSGEGEDTPKDDGKEDSPEVKKHKAKIKELEDAIEGLKDKKDKKSKNDLGVIQAALKSEKDKLEKAKKSNESNLYEGMSVSDKFRALMNK